MDRDDPNVDADGLVAVAQRRLVVDDGPLDDEGVPSARPHPQAAAPGPPRRCFLEVGQVAGEAALHAVVGTREVMAGQLDRLVGLIGMSTVELGIVTLGAPVPLTLKHGLWIFDEERVVVETINTELQYDSADDLALYGRMWDQLDQAAAHGPKAHRPIARARAAIAAT
ncbi:Scr1 family TA system antitoxin-like transcriptional regulator [Streptomyces sp. NPDC056949]|uniref:Scr1 family TA system antitoxin-like transcriptional regulator n=1 Tax=Streptomyces sp. NPDC056949 TaxID=3345976 RepID=UPI00362B8F00